MARANSATTVSLALFQDAGYQAVIRCGRFSIALIHHQLEPWLVLAPDGSRLKTFNDPELALEFCLSLRQTIIKEA